MTNSPEVLLGVTGSIGAYKSGDIVRDLREAGYDVTCVMTHRATNFISPWTLQTLSERKAHVELFDANDSHILHTTLAERAKLVIVAPATANIISKLANGVADNLLSCLLLAVRAKILIAPAMNVNMWQHPTVQRNVTTLKRLGVRFVGPEVGKLACGYEGIGHLASVEEIVRVARQLVPALPANAAISADTQAKTKRKTRAKTKTRKAKSSKKKGRKR